MAEPEPPVELARVLRRAGRLRGHAALLLSLGSVLLFWRVIFMPTAMPIAPVQTWLPQTAFSIALNLAVLQQVARFFARTPRFHTREDIEHSGTVREWSARFNVPPPKLLVSRSRYLPPIGIRGWQGDVAIIITTETLVRWSRSEATRTVHLTHELAHVWARDLRLYYWTRSLSTVALLVLLLIAYFFAINGDPTANVALFLAKVLVLAGLTLLAGRAYLRFREHVADVTAMLVTDDVVKVRAELVDGKDQTALGRIIGTHPTSQDRRAVLFNPMLLLKSERWSFLLLGVAVGFFTSAATYFLAPIARGAGVPVPSAAWAAAVASAVMLAATLPKTISEQFLFRSTPTRDTLLHAWLVFTGAGAGLLLLSPMQLIPAEVVRPGTWLLAAGAAFAAAVLTTIGCLVVIMTAEDGVPKARSSLIFRLLMFTAMLGTLVAVSRLFTV